MVVKDTLNKRRLFVTCALVNLFVSRRKLLAVAVRILLQSPVPHLDDPELNFIT